MEGTTKIWSLAAVKFNMQVIKERRVNWTTWRANHDRIVCNPLSANDNYTQRQHSCAPIYCIILRHCKRNVNNLAMCFHAFRGSGRLKNVLEDIFTNYLILFTRSICKKDIQMCGFFLKKNTSKSFVYFVVWRLHIHFIWM